MGAGMRARRAQEGSTQNGYPWYGLTWRGLHRRSLSSINAMGLCNEITVAPAATEFGPLTRS